MDNVYDEYARLTSEMDNVLSNITRCKKCVHYTDGCCEFYERKFPFINKCDEIGE